LLRVWQRLIEQETTEPESIAHSKPFVLAITYMLHVERLHIENNDEQKPRSSTNNPRRLPRSCLERLRKLCVWIQCDCGKSCMRRWNFVDEIGISYVRGQCAEEVICPILCLVSGIGEASRDHYAILEAMRRKWNILHPAS
jgi:hypothetical protein